MTAAPIKLCLLISIFFAMTSAARADYRAADEAAKTRNWSVLLQECKADADAGEKNCQSWLGWLYKNGFGVERNLPLSVTYFKSCAAKGQMYCEEMLGDSYKNGMGVNVDYAEALRLFRSSAAKGNPWAFNNLGNMYRAGQGVTKDSVQAVKQYKIAADKGNGQAQANLANMYRLGEGIEQNADAAFQYALKSSQQNYGAGWNILGLLYRDGQGVRQDSAMAVNAFKKAVNSTVNHPEHIAYANLGLMFYQGDGVAASWNEAAKWAEAGTKLKQRNSMVLLSSILAQGSSAIPADHARAFELAQKAYKMGLVSAAENLGWFYRDGVGTSVDLSMAVRYFTEGRDSGNISSYASLGRMYQEGLGVDKDPEKARELLLVAKAQINRLGPGNRKFVENYFASGPEKISQNTNTQTSSTLSSSNSQQALIDRLEKMQKQLETLQASANTTSASQAMQGQIYMVPRKALVIGNDKYQHLPPLLNARQDAAAIAKSLTQLGYTVSLYQDLNDKSFKQALREFRGSLEGNEEVLFFFAGHGVQLGATNYLITTDTRGANEDQVKDEAIDLQRVLDDLKTKNPKFALAIIDACRENPFKQSGRAIGGRGLAPTTAATGQMIMFSAGAGQQALDKLGNADHEKNGVFTRVLLKEMVKPGVPVDRVLRNVRSEVVRLSKTVGHEQTPALYDQSVGDYYFSLK